MKNRTINSLSLFFLIVVVLYQPVFCRAQDSSELWKLYNQGEYPLVLEIVLPLLKEFPGEVELNLLAGRALSDTGEKSKAVPYLEQVVKSLSIKKLWSDQNTWASYPDGISYPLAGAFVWHLISQGGKNKFMQLLSRQTYQSAREIYGDRLDELITSFENKLFQ